MSKYSKIGRCLFLIASYSAQENSFPFKQKYKSIGLTITSLVPKESTFDYYFAKLHQAQTPNWYDVYYNTEITQHYNIGIGLEYSFYWKTHSGFKRAWYITPTIGLNLYNQRFDKRGQEYIKEAFFFMSQINERSTNILVEPGVSVSHQIYVSKGKILNFETGLGFNYHVFYRLKKSSFDETSGCSEDANYSAFPLQLFLKVPFKIEYLFEIKSKWVGIAVLTQVNDSRALFNSALQHGDEVNSIGTEHDVGLNSPVFLYRTFSGNNYPGQSFCLVFSFSYKL